MLCDMSKTVKENFAISVVSTNMNKAKQYEMHNMGDARIEDNSRKIKFGEERKSDDSHEQISENSEKKKISIDVLDKIDRRAGNSRTTYAAKKTVAQGMMDVALITANANQLRYLIEYQRSSSTFYVNVVLIICSLILQIAVGVSLIFKGRFDIRGESKSHAARKIDNYVVVGVFLTTIINVFVAAFSISLPKIVFTRTTPTNGTR